MFVDLERRPNRAVTKLRGALGDDPDNPYYIETLPRKGNRFIGTITRPKGPIPPNNSELQPPLMEAIAPATDLATNPPQPSDSAELSDAVAAAESNRQNWMWTIGIASLIALAIVAVAIYRANRASQFVSPVALTHS